MLEIVIMYGAVATIFVLSLVIGFIKSTRAVIVLGGLLTIVAIGAAGSLELNNITISEGLLLIASGLITGVSGLVIYNM